MLMTLKHNLPDHRIGDTFQGEIFRLVENVAGVPSPIDLSKCLIRMDVRTQAKQPIVLRLTNYKTANPVYPGEEGIQILDGPDGKFWIKKQILSPLPATYVYDIEFSFYTQDLLALNGVIVFPDEVPDVQTLIEGFWTFTQDITHD